MNVWKPRASVTISATTTWVVFTAPASLATRFMKIRHHAKVGSHELGENNSVHRMHYLTESINM